MTESREDRLLARKKARADQAETAAKSYLEGHTLMQVAEEMGVSYGKAHALVGEGGATIRPRGGRPLLPAKDAGDP